MVSDHWKATLKKALENEGELLSPHNSKQRRFYLKPPFEGVYLTRREYECALYLRAGKTMRETAEGLALSPRTVEYYLRHVKAKLNCIYKHRLKAIFKDVL